MTDYVFTPEETQQILDALRSHPAVSAMQMVLDKANKHNAAQQIADRLNDAMQNGDAELVPADEVER